MSVGSADQAEGAGPLWSVEMRGRVAIATYFNPPMNYATSAAVRELSLLVDSWADPAIRAVVLGGANPGRFITHFDVSEILSTNVDRERFIAAGPKINYEVHDLLNRLHSLDKPVIAALNGDTMGFGFELSLATDFRIDQYGDFRYGLPEVRLGILPGGTGTQRLARLVGVNRALELILRARVFTPEEALEMGAVSELADDALARAIVIATEIANLPAGAVGIAKRVIYQARELTMAAASVMEIDAAFRAKLDPESVTRMSEYVALPFEDRRAWLDQASRPDSH